MVIPLFTLGLSQQPVAIIKGGDKHLEFIKIKKFEAKYFATTDSRVYEIDDQYEYRYKNTSVYFYNFSNPKPLSLKAMDEIDLKLRAVGDTELLNRERYIDMMSAQPDVDLSKIEMPTDHTTELSAETRRFLQDYSTDDESTKTNMMIKVTHQKKPITVYSTPLIPMGTNRGHYAFIQTGHKRIDIVPMSLHNDRAYTKYGVFEFTRDNFYLVKKQMLGMFILNDTEKDPAQPMPKKANGMMNFTTTATFLATSNYADQVNSRYNKSQSHYVNVQQRIKQSLENKIKLVDIIMFEHHYDNMIIKNYKFNDIHTLLKNNGFQKVYKIKMPFRKSFDYIYENQVRD